MASKLQKLLSTLIFLFTVLDSPATTTPQECPYPCIPPPTGPGGNNPPVTTTPPVFTTPPTGFLPFTPPPPYSLGAGLPPPPDPAVPWFPYFYKKPPHQIDQSFSSPALRGSGNIIFFAFPLVFALSYCFHY